MSDIQLGDDESVTIECTRLNAVNSSSVGKAVELHGPIELFDRVWVTIEDFETAKRKVLGSITSSVDMSAKLSSALGPGALVFDPTAGSLVPAHAAGPGVGLSSETHVSGFDLWLHLRGGTGRVDLATELALMRAAILELHQRLGGG